MCGPYRYTRAGELGSQVNEDGATTAPRFTDLGRGHGGMLFPGITYFYTVRPVDGVGLEPTEGDEQVVGLAQDLVAAVDPEDGATGVPTGTAVTVTFSREVRVSSVTSSSFLVRSGETGVTGGASVASDGLSATFAPQEVLREGTLYEVVLTPGIKETDGESLPVELVTSFTVEGVAQPFVSALTPASGIPGDEVVIRGSAFSPVSTQNRVTFGGVSAQVRSASATQLTVVVPSGARTGPVVVTVGTQRSNEVPFTVEGVPTLLRLMPDIGLAGTEVTIEGSAFSLNPEDNRVTFGGIEAQVVSAAADRLVAVAPEGVFTGPVVVQRDGETSNALTFTVARVSISEVRVSNRTSSGATMTWFTDLPSDGTVRFGTTSSLGYSAAEEAGSRIVHSVEVTSLEEDTEYRFEVTSGGTTDDNEGTKYTFRSLRPGYGKQRTVFGQIFQEDGAPAAEALVVMTVENASGRHSLPLSDRTDEEGNYDFNLANLKDPTTADHVFAFASGDRVHLEAMDGTGGYAASSSLQIDLTGWMQDFGTLVLGQAPALPGDFTGDGRVDLSDFSRFVTAYGLSAPAGSPYVLFDLDGSGTVDLGDFSIFVRNYGKSIGSAKAMPVALGSDGEASLSLDVVDPSEAGSGKVHLEVRFDGARALKGYHFKVRYDPRRLDFVEANRIEEGFLHGGSSQWPLLVLSSQAGEVTVADVVRGDRAIQSGRPLVELSFQCKGAPEDVGFTVAEGMFVDAEGEMYALGSAEAALLPQDLALLHNFPNPFNASTAIRYRLPEASETELGVYDLLGQEVRRLVDGRAEAGTHSVLWDGRDGDGKAVGSGIYLCRLKVGAFVRTRRALLIK